MHFAPVGRQEGNCWGQNIAILIGSQAAIKAVTSYQIDSELMWECLNRPNTLGSINKVWSGRVGQEGSSDAPMRARAIIRMGLREIYGVNLYSGSGAVQGAHEMIQTQVLEMWFKPHHGEAVDFYGHCLEILREWRNLHKCSGSMSGTCVN